MNKCTKFGTGKWVLFICLACSWLHALVGCGNGVQQGAIEGKVNVVTSFYPISYMVQEIGGAHVNPINLVPAGVEPHDWTPTGRDLQQASKSQLLMVNGAGFERWLDDFKKGLESTSKVKIIEVSKGIALMDISGTRERADEHVHQAHGIDHEEHRNVDPHTWVSPKSALVMVKNVKDALVQADEDATHRADYEQNYERLKRKLEAIAAKYEQSLQRVKHHDIVVSHHAFGYVSRDYGLTQHAIMGITADAEPQAQDLLRLTKLIRERGLSYLFLTELASDRMAQTLASEANVNVLVLSPLEGMTKEQMDAGENYITLMERNLQHLLLALHGAEFATSPACVTMK